jgi:hypothetical protein
MARHLLPLDATKPGSLLVEALDYGPVVEAVYRPNNFSVCSDKPIECWLRLSTVVDCQRLFYEYVHTLQHHKPVFPPPKELPADQKDVYLLRGFTHLEEVWVEQADHAPDALVPVWNQTMYNGLLQLAQACNQL